MKTRCEGVRRLSLAPISDRARSIRGFLSVLVTLVGCSLLFSSQASAQKHKPTPVVAGDRLVDTLLPKDGPLTVQLQREATLAAKANKIAFVEVGNTWCHICQETLNIFRSRQVIDAMRQDARVVYLSYDDWHYDLLTNGYEPGITAFFTLTPDGKSGAVLEEETIGKIIGIADSLHVQNSEAAVPVLKDFLAKAKPPSVSGVAGN